MMVAFHGSEEVKAKCLARFMRHQELGKMCKYGYWSDSEGQGCGAEVRFGPTRNYEGRNYETEFGIPLDLAKIKFEIFDGMDSGKCQPFPVQFINSIKVGADLGQVADKFLYWLVEGQYSEKSEGDEALKAVSNLYARKVKGGKVAPEEWDAAASLCFHSSSDKSYSDDSDNGPYGPDEADDSDCALSAAGYCALFQDGFYRSLHLALAYGSRCQPYSLQAAKLLELLDSANDK